MTRTIQIQLPADEALRQIAHTYVSHLGETTVTLDQQTTCIEALRIITEHLVKNENDRSLAFFPPQERKKKNASQLNTTPQELKIRNALPASSLPPPKFASPRIKANLKEDFDIQIMNFKPYHTPNTR